MRPESCHARCWVKVYTRGPLNTRRTVGKWLITKSRQNPTGRQRMTERARQKSLTGVVQARGVIGGSCEVAGWEGVKLLSSRSNVVWNVVLPG